MPRIHLDKKGCSGRGVRYRILTGPELEENEVQAAKLLDKDATRAAYNVGVMRLGLNMMIQAVTPKDVKDPATATWEAVDQSKLDIKWTEYFTTRDTVILKAIFEREHGCTEAEVQDILSGKVEELAD